MIISILVNLWLGYLLSRQQFLRFWLGATQGRIQTQRLFFNRFDLLLDFRLIGIELQGFFPSGESFIAIAKTVITVSDGIQDVGINTEMGDGSVENGDSGIKFTEGLMGLTQEKIRFVSSLG